MAVFSARSKRVTDPLDDKVKARLIGSDHHFHLSSLSSGSEHSSAHQDDDSPCLSELVHGFLHDQENDDDDNPQSRPPFPPTTTSPYDSDSDLLESSAPDRENQIDEIVTSLNSNNNAESYRRLLLHHLSKSIEKFSSLLRSDKSALLRNVMAFLRELGHNAAICKTKWTSSASGSLTSGNHDFIDVVRSPGRVRYFVELDFVSEFEIARPTDQYSRMLQCLPRIFVGTAEELKRIVKVLCNGARRSLRSRDLLVSPWRKNLYMQKKWFAPYRRTVNSIPEKSTAAKATEAVGAAYRCVGFDDVVSDVNNNSQFFVRTR